MRDTVKQIRKSEGFTIIEVLIVLVIAASIMLLVFLAVPALQRNSRNTQRKQDASALLSSASEWTSNNNGTQPSSIGTLLTDTFPASKRAYYKTDPQFQPIQVLTSGSATQSNSENITLVEGAKCGTVAAGGSQVQAAVPGTSRSSAVIYATETSGGTTPQCIESGV